MTPKKQFTHVARIIPADPNEIEMLMPLDRAAKLWDMCLIRRIDLGAAYPYAFQQVVRG